MLSNVCASRHLGRQPTPHDMEGSGIADKEGAKEKDEIDDKEAKHRKTITSSKSTSSKLKERWLMTRKTWRYMTDAGKKLFPEGVSPQRSADIPKVQEHFQKTCRKSKEFILWPYQGSLPPEGSVTVPGSYHHESVRRKSRTSTRTSSGIKIPRERRRPGNIQPPPHDFFEDDPGGSSSLPCSPTQTNFAQIASDLAWIIEPEVYSQMVRLHGTSYLQKIASRLLEDQLTEVDESDYEEEEGVELLDINGKRMRSIGAQTDSQLDMCVQTDHDDTAKDRVHVIAETRDEMFERVLKEREDEQRQAETQQQQQQDQQPQQSGTQGSSRNPNKPKPLQLQQQQQQQQPFQKETPVLKKFWGRRESRGAEQIQVATPVGEKSGRGLASEKDREAPPPKGGVAAKLASLEATSTQPPPKDSTKPKTSQQPAQKSPPAQQVGEKPQTSNKSEKKTLKNVFKLGLKCDIESSDPVKNKNLEKQNADKFKTVNYDKTLRNIKTKWSKEDDENLRQLLAQQEMCEPHRDIPKKKKRSRGIQVGDALPQFILSALRVSSPVEIFYATRKRIRRRSSKAESTDMTGSEGSVSLASSMPTSPRYSITVADEAGTRNILLSEADALKLSLRGATLYNKRTSLDASFDSADGEGGGPLMGGIPREFPFGLGPGGAPLYQRSMSAHQMSASVPPSHLLYSGAGGKGAAAAAAAARGHRLSLLQNLLPAVMQRTRTGGGSAAHSSRLVAKRIWRTRSKSQSRASAATTSTWFPTASNEWVSVTGVRVPLEPTSLLHLTELERLTLQRLALARLAALNLGCPVNIPKDSSGVSSGKKRRPYLLKRKALTTGFFDSRKDDAKETLTPNSNGGHVFGLSLSKCLENERIRQQQAAELSAAVAATAAATVAATSGGGTGPRRGSVGFDRAVAGGEEPEGGLSRKSSRTGSRASFCSLAEGAKQSSTGSLESLNLDRKRPSLASGDLLSPAGVCPSDLLQVEPPLAQVPSLVTSCCNHLLQHGLHTVGIFRVSSSKKRVRQLREEFDRSGDVQLTADHCPHDVATLLKEFFRDLPEPLLSRDLYEPFLKTQKIRNRQLKLEATQHLLQLLPAANRNTLCALLTFLTTVAEHAVDSTTERGETIPGNMMDSTNLATMFAPNILHMHRAGAENVSPASLAAMADERTDCINVVRSMINHSKELFEVSTELLNATYHDLMDTHPEALDLMLRRRAPGPDDRGQRLLQQLLASLLQSGRFPPGSPPYSPPHAGLEADIESGGSSVFEGSECSSSLPRSPTEHHEFERLRGGEDGAEGCRARRRDPPSMDGVGSGLPDDPASRRKTEDDGKPSSCAEVPGEDRGWFRRRDKSSSRELDGKGCDEKPQAERSRWFRRRERTSPRGSLDYGFRRKGSDKKKHEKMLRQEEKLMGKRQSSGERGRRESDSENADYRDRRQRSTSDQTVVQERLRVPEESVRRLSSPEIDGYGVITASLKIPVPLHQQCTSTSFCRESDIPFIEDTVLAEEARTRRREGSVTSRQRTGSSDSYLGQPITGTMSFQPLCKRDGEKQSHDSVLSSSSADMFTLSPSPRNTPLSDALFASETSSNLSRTTSPPLVLSPDSGTPGLSPPPSPPPPLPRRTRRVEQTTSRTVPVTHSATHTFSSSRSSMVSAISVRGERRGSQTTSVPITRSRTAEVPTCIGSNTGASDKSKNLSRDPPSGAFKSSSTSRMIGIETSTSRGGDASGGLKRYARRRPTRQRDETTDPQPQSGQHNPTEYGSSAQLWKRCEIIASKPGEPEGHV